MRLRNSVALRVRIRVPMRVRISVASDGKN